MRWSARPSQGPERWSVPPTVADIKYTAAPRIEIPDDEEPDRLPAPGSLPPAASIPPEGTPELAALLEDLRTVIASARAQTLELRREALEKTERDLVHLAIAIAKRVVGREVETDPTIVTAWAREGIDALSSHDRVVVALAPEVLEALEASGERTAFEEVADVVSDPRLSRAECEVRGKFGRIDESVRARLDAVVAALDLDDDEEDETP